jgi:hypothetical protein
MPDDSTDLEIDLEPIDPTNLRSTGTGVWETVRGKRNRITIGQPRWLDPADALEAATMAKLRAAYRPDDYTLQLLQLSLTLLPDRHCRFRHAELALTLTAESADPSNFVYLNPREEVTTLLITTDSPVGHVTLQPIAVLGGDITTGGRHKEITRSEATIEAFGTGSPEAGWRLSMTHAREIPLDTPDLQVAVAQGVGHEGSLLINAVAEIEVLTAGDRWLTWAFKRTRPEVEFALTLPPLPRSVGQ